VIFRFHANLQGCKPAKTLWESHNGFTTGPTPCLPTDRLKHLESIHAEVTAFAERGNVIDFVYMGVSLNGGTPQKHPKMSIFSRNTYGCWVPSFLETPISTTGKLVVWVGDLGFSRYTITQTTNLPLAETWLKCKNSGKVGKCLSFPESSLHVRHLRNKKNQDKGHP